MTGIKRASEAIRTDPVHAPELTEQWFATVDLYEGEKLVRCRGRPRKAAPKKVVKIRLDADVVALCRAGGPGRQPRINAALRKAVGLKGLGLPVVFCHLLLRLFASPA